MSSGYLAGTKPLLRATLREDGRTFAPWIALATLLSTTSVLVYPWVFPDQASREGLGLIVGSNPTLGVIFGPAFNLLTADGFNAWRSLALGGFLAALGAIFAVTGHTRAQEDSGSAELIASAPVGRGSRLMAATGFAFLGAFLVGAVAGLLTVPFGGGWEDSLLLGATFTATGWMFAAVAAVAAQLGADRHAASSIAVGTFGVLFLLRGFAYSLDWPAWTVWANPLGWMTETRPAAGDEWWPLLLAIAFALAMLAVAFALEAHRDFGMGMVPPRPGPRRGRIRSVWGLTLRLNRATLITWTVVFIVWGLVFGRFVSTVPELLSKNSAVAAVLAAGAATHAELVSTFLKTILSLLGIIASVPGVQVMLRLRSEELQDRTEPVLATRVSRRSYFGASVVTALVASGVYVLLAGALLALIASSANIGITFGDALLQAAATIPATWVIIAFAAVIVGVRPKVAVAAWTGAIASFALTFLGPILNLWDWILGISPFWHLPSTGAPEPDWSGIAWLALFWAGFLLVGFAGFSRRDIAHG